MKTSTILFGIFLFGFLSLILTKVFNPNKSGASYEKIIIENLDKLDRDSAEMLCYDYQNWRQGDTIFILFRKKATQPPFYKIKRADMFETLGVVKDSFVLKKDIQERYFMPRIFLGFE